MNVEPIVIIGGLVAVAVVAIVVISLRNDKRDAKPQTEARWEAPAPTVRVIPAKKKAPVKKTAAKKAAPAKKAPAKKAAPKKK